MPKQLHYIRDFSGGVNSQRSPRDINDNQSPFCQDVIGDKLGSLRTMGDGTADPRTKGHGSSAITLSTLGSTVLDGAAGYGFKHFDCTILEGHRGKERQDKAYADGKSKVKYPDGKHNQFPSVAVDVAPYPIDWSDRDRFHYFGGFVLGVAKQMGMNIRWGGDWNQDTKTKDNKFDDLVHFEIKG